MILIMGAGFIGMSLYRYFRSEGLEAAVFSRSTPANAPQDFFQGDVNDPRQYEKLLNRTDTIIYTIHTTVPSTSMHNDIYDVETNVIPFLKFIEACRDKQIHKCIYLSSGGAVYGNSVSALPLTEQSPTNPISSYGITKLMNEKYLQMHASVFTEGITILRPSNIYGRFQKTGKPHGVIAHLLEAAYTGGIMQIWGDGSASKDYLYMQDLLEAIRSLISDTGLPVRLFNLAYGRTTTILDLIAIVEELTGRKINVQFTAPRQFDVHHVALDAGLFRETYEWEPKYGLSEGIVDILKHITPASHTMTPGK